MATLRNHPGYWLRDDAAAEFNQAEADNGVFVVNSAGRTVAEQQNLINKWNQGGTYNRPPYLYKPAMPATASNHVANGGVAVDIGDWRRFAQVCERYGFDHSFPTATLSTSTTSVVEQVPAADRSTRRQGPAVAHRSVGYNLGPVRSRWSQGVPTRSRLSSSTRPSFVRSVTPATSMATGSGYEGCAQRLLTSLNNANAELKAQQQWLISRNYNLGPKGADGVWGPSTESRLQAVPAVPARVRLHWRHRWSVGSGNSGGSRQVLCRCHVASACIGCSGIPAARRQVLRSGSRSEFHQRLPLVLGRASSVAAAGCRIAVGPSQSTVCTASSATPLLAATRLKLRSRSEGEGSHSLTASSVRQLGQQRGRSGHHDASDSRTAEPDRSSGGYASGRRRARCNSEQSRPPAAHFPSWIRFETVTDPEGQKANLNKEAAEYYGVPYNPVEAHLLQVGTFRSGVEVRMTATSTTSRTRRTSRSTSCSARTASP